MIEFVDQDRSIPKEHHDLLEKAVDLVLSTDHYSVNIVSCSDEFILETNRSALAHDYYTDIITFHYEGPEYDIEAELLISLDRVKENALSNNVSFLNELARVVIHGCLHLKGYDDHSEEEKQLMRSQEDHFLKQLFHVEHK